MSEERKIFGLNENGELMVVNFATHKPPVFVEKKDTDWIIYGNEKGFVNLYPQYLIELYNRANTHNSCINAKIHYVAGNGFDVDTTGLNIERKSILLKQLNEPNSFSETISDIAIKCASDFEIDDVCHIEVIWNKAGKDFDFCHMDFTKLRRDKDEKGWWFSDDWSKSKNKQTKEETRLEFIPDFDIKNPKGKQIYTLKNYRPAMKWYTLPNYIAGIPYAEIDWEIANFHATGIKSGFYAGTILTLFGQKPTQEEKDAFYDSASESFTGTDRANSLFIINARDKDSAPQLVRLTPDNIHEQFTTLKTDTSEQLFLAHRMSKILLGMQTPGTLGQRSELIEAAELFKNSYVKIRQKKLNDWFNALFSVKGFENRLSLKQVDPVSLFDPADIIKVMTPDEIREEAGLPPLPKNTEPPQAKEQPMITSVHHQFSDCCEEKFSAEDASEEMNAVASVIPVFSQFGISQNNFEILESIEVDFSGSILKESKFLSPESDDLKMLYKNILELIKKDNLIDAQTLADVLKKKSELVQKAINYLVENEYLKESTATSGGEKVPKYSLTDSGNNILDDFGSKMANVQIMYSYAPRPGLQPIVAGTRPFCRALIESNKFYSRKDIETISSRVGHNVWEMRGGWWRKKKKEGGAIYPFCRHVWQQNVVREKIK